MNVEQSIRNFLSENRAELIKNNLDIFLDKSRKREFSFEDVLSLSDEFTKMGLFSLNSSLLKTILSQENFNYFIFSKQAPLPQDDIYKIDLKKHASQRISEDSYQFFKGGLFEKYYPFLLEKLKDSLINEKKYIEAQGILGVHNKEVNNTNIDSQLEEILASGKKFNKENFYPTTSPESSYILRFDSNFSNLKKTVQSLNSFDNKKELILLINNAKDLEKLKNERFIRENLLSIESEEGVKNVFRKGSSNLNIRIIDLGEERGQYIPYNIGTLKALFSSPNYISFLKNGDVLAKEGFLSLKSELENGKEFVIGGMSYLNKQGKEVDDINLRFRKYITKNLGKDYLNEFENYSLFDFSNHLILSKNLEEILISDKFIFDPRLDQNSAENDFFRRFVNKYSHENVSYKDNISAHREKEADFETKNGKKNIIFITSTLENTHGVPVVVNNLSNNLDKSKYNVFYLVNDFDSKKIKFYDSTKKNFIEASNRKELFEILKSHNSSFFDDVDIIHSHTWHLADDFKHFHTKNINTGIHEEDETKFKDFLNYFSKAKFIFTDHSNPSEDLANINESYFPNSNYENLSDREKQNFIDKNKLKVIDSSPDWISKWALTSIAGRKQMASLADLVINVSNAQNEEGKRIIPEYNYLSQKTVYNGIDLIDLTKNSSVDKRIQSTSDLLKKDYGIQKEDNIILYAGRLSRRKGIYDLANSLKKLKNGMNNIKLLIVGNADPKVKDELKELSGINNIIYTGKIDDREELAAFYRLADLTVQPTHGECFNQVIGESLSQGTPVITTAVSGPKEVYVKNHWAYGVERTKDDEQNIKNLTYAIKDALLHKYELKEDVKKRIIPEIREKLSLEKTVREHEIIYKNILKNNGLNKQ
jgi:glycosyltransferase involved in cell wall biosynthesis